MRVVVAGFELETIPVDARILFGLTLVSMAALACGGDGQGDGATGTTGSPCAAGEAQAADGACVAPACGVGEAPDAAGVCHTVGVAPDACAMGFEADDFGGCSAVLPPEPCAPGQLAVPGELACRDVAPCGAGPWGDIPVDASTEYVDGAYDGADSDGSEERPWRTIQDGVDAAATGAIVAVAAGEYAEDLALHKHVRLWGRCPSMVTIEASEVGIEILADAEVNALAVTGGAYGLATSGARDVRLSQLWVHDIDGDGLDVQDVLGPTNVSIRDSLFEAARGVAIFVDGPGAHAVVDRSVVRDTALVGPEGAALHLEEGASAELTGSILERSSAFALYVFGSTATVSATVVRDTYADAEGLGRGIYCLSDLHTRARGAMTVDKSVVEGNAEGGIYIGGCDVTVDATVARNNGFARGGAGIAIQDDVGGRGKLTLNASLVQGNVGAGMQIIAADVSISGCAIRESRSDPLGFFGTGIDVGVGATASVIESALDQNQQVGLLAFGSDVTAERVVVRETAPSGLGRFGDGIAVLSLPNAPSVARLTRVSIASCARAALSNFSGHVTLGETTMMCNAFEMEGEVTGDVPFTFDSLGNNRCGCPDPIAECQVLSNGLDAPEPVPHLGD